MSGERYYAEMTELWRRADEAERKVKDLARQSDLREQRETRRDAKYAAKRAIDDLEYLDGMLDDREREN